MARKTRRAHPDRARDPAREAAERALLEALAQLYRDADGLYAGHRCESSTECCRFGITGREPYVTSLELSMLERAIRARGGKLSERRRALPLAGSRDRERTCPLLADGGRCSVYASRPLGCRTFWCARAVSDHKVTQQQLNALVARLRALSAQHAAGGEHGSPLSRALQA